MANAVAALHGRIARYYGAKVRRHGATPEGVDWPSERTQQLRFEQLLRVCDFSQPCSLNDVGCGWGALLRWLERTGTRSGIDYLGVDVSAAMIACAKQLWREPFEVGSRASRIADYSVASGLFNVRIDEPMRLWERFVAQTLEDLDQTSTRGFAVNFLKPLPRGTDTVPELYRPPASRWRRFCEEQLGRRVEVLEGYGLREVTLLVRA